MKYLIEVPDGTVYGYDKDKKILIFQEKDFIEVSEVSNLIYLPNVIPYEESIDNKFYNTAWTDGYEKGVEAGRDDAWEFVGIICDMTRDERKECFGGSTCDIDEYMTYQEAKSKYETWKKSKEEIRVGDEIRIKTSYSADAVVIGMDDYDLFIVWKDGETDRIEPPERKQWVKTGKHFPEVEELLKKITEESNED